MNRTPQSHFQPLVRYVTLNTRHAHFFNRLSKICWPAELDWNGTLRRRRDNLRFRWLTIGRRMVKILARMERSVYMAC